MHLITNILVICVGNICRSPMAEALLSHTLSNLTSKKPFLIRSAGIGALQGHPADDHAQTLMAELGLDISNHRATQLNHELVQWADLILVMETSHKHHIESQFPTARGKIYRLREWDQLDIEDPYRLDLDAFRTCLSDIERGVASWQNKLEGV